MYRVLWPLSDTSGGELRRPMAGPAASGAVGRVAADRGGGAGRGHDPGRGGCARRRYRQPAAAPGRGPVMTAPRPGPRGPGGGAPPFDFERRDCRSGRGPSHRPPPRELGPDTAQVIGRRGRRARGPPRGQQVRVRDQGIVTWSRWFGQLEGLVKVYSDCEITPSSSSAPALTGGCHGWHEAGSYPVIDDDDALWNCGNLAAGAQAWAAALAREISNGLWAPASPPSGFSATVSGRPQAGQVHIAGWDMVLGPLMR